MVAKDVFRQIGLFDETFEKQRMGDGEFGLRCYLNGLKVIENPKAYCVDLKAKTGGLRIFNAKDAFNTGSFIKPVPVPSVLYFTRKYFGRKSSIYYLFKSIPYIFLPYRWKKRTYLFPFCYFLAVILAPLIFFRILRSWILSARMLNNPVPIEFIP